MDFEGLVNLIAGLEKIAHSELNSRRKDRFDQASLNEVLDNLRIVIEPDWREVNGVISWDLPETLPVVMADAHGLLQVFLSMVENSYRAVQESSNRELSISVSVEEYAVLIHVKDSGTGVAAPDHLFQPFQVGANGTGMGLYIARAVLRTYGGDLRFVQEAGGARFVVELQVCDRTTSHGSTGNQNQQPAYH